MRWSQSVIIIGLLEVFNVLEIKWWEFLEDGQRRFASLGTQHTEERMGKRVREQQIRTHKNEQAGGKNSKQ